MTLDQIQKMGVALTNRCYLCLECAESMDHLLLYYAKMRSMWELLFSLFGTTWVFPKSVRDTFMSWGNFRVGKKQRKV